MKKFVTALLALLVSMSMLFGCTNTGESVGSGTEKRETETEENLDTETEKQETETESQTQESAHVETENQSTETETNEDETANTFEILPEHIEYAKSDIRYKWIVSFLTGDAQGCAEVLSDLGYGKSKDFTGYVDEVKTLEFSSYTVSPGNNEYELIFIFEISSSAYDLYPAGKYRTVIQSGILKASMHFVSTPSDPASETLANCSDAKKFLDGIISPCYDADYPDEYNKIILTEQLFEFYRDANGQDLSEQLKLTYDELKSVANEVYNIENFEIDIECLDDCGDGHYRLRGHGGITKAYKIINIVEEGDNVIFDVQYYGDCMRFSDAGVTRFTLQKTSSPYGYKLIEIKRIEVTDISAYDYGV